MEPASGPAAVAASQPSPAARLVDQIDNSQVTEWYFWRDETGLTNAGYWPWKLTGTARRVVFLPSNKTDPLHADCADVARSLIRALDDPRRFIAAHLILRTWWWWEFDSRHRYQPPHEETDDEFGLVRFAEEPDHTVVCNADGMQVRLKQVDEDSFTADVYHSVRYFCTATIDPAQRPLLRDRWNRRERELLRAFPEWVKEEDAMPQLGVNPADELFEAIGSRNAGEAMRLIRSGINVNYAREDKSTPLFFAVELGMPKDVLDTLVKHGARVNASCLRGFTPLHAACGQSSLAMVKYLVDHGADVNATDDEGWTPLHVASTGPDKGGQEEIIKFLLLHGADVNAENRKGFTPLDRAVKEDDAAAMAILRSAGGRLGHPHK